MKTNDANGEDARKEPGFKLFAAKRIVIGLVLTVAVLWISGSLLGFFDRSPHSETATGSKAVETDHSAESSHSPADADQTHDAHSGSATEEALTAKVQKEVVALGRDTPAELAIDLIRKKHRHIEEPFQIYVVDEHNRPVGSTSLKQLLFADPKALLRDIMQAEIHSVGPGASVEEVAALAEEYELKEVPVIDKSGQLAGVVRAADLLPAHRQSTAGQQVASADEQHAPPAASKQAAGHDSHAEPSAAGDPHAKPVQTAHDTEGHGDTHAAEQEEDHGIPHGPPPADRIKGAAFIDATIQPLDHELTQRFWGWRPNDILDVTDNVNNFQLGVLEVTRRTAVNLAEEISRTGSTDSFDPHLENAMNWFMIKSDRYWLPSPESKYKAGLDELRAYQETLKRREAKFHTRTDNLIPLLMDYEDLLGSCDENLVKMKEEDGRKVSHFKADDYFYYSQGVASTLHSILSAIYTDYYETIEARRGLEVLHHAIESCHHAMVIAPWYITDASPGGILANHRANLAAPISHARFYIGVLIKTLST